MRLQTFIGQARTSIDSKGRTAFPREFRKFFSDEDGAEVVVAPGPQQSLILYSIQEWDLYTASLAARPKTQANDRFIQQMVSYACHCELDGQNRILIPSHLQKHAQLNAEVLFAARGGKKCGLWNPERYEALYGLGSKEAQLDFDGSFYESSTPEVPR